MIQVYMGKMKANPSFGLSCRLYQKDTRQNERVVIDLCMVSNDYQKLALFNSQRWNHIFSMNSVLRDAYVVDLLHKGIADLRGTYVPEVVETLFHLQGELFGIALFMDSTGQLCITNVLNNINIWDDDPVEWDTTLSDEDARYAKMVIDYKACGYKGDLSEKMALEEAIYNYFDKRKTSSVEFNMTRDDYGGSSLLHFHKATAVNTNLVKNHRLVIPEEVVMRG